MSAYEPDYAAKSCKCGAPACVMHWFSMLGGHGYAVQCMALHKGDSARRQTIMDYGTKCAGPADVMPAGPELLRTTTNYQINISSPKTV